MKNALFILGILMVSSALAQQHFVGITMGGGLSNVHGGKIFDNRAERPVLQGGVSYTYQFAGKFHFESNLIYTERGFHNDVIFTNEVGVPTGETGRADFNYNYLALPLKGGVSFGNKLIGLIRVGAVPAILLHAETVGPAFHGNPGISTNLTSNVRTFDVAGLFEIGMDAPISNSFSASATAAFMHSFTSFTTKDYFLNDNMIHYGLILSIGVKYALGKN